VAEQPGCLVITSPIVVVERRHFEGGFDRMALWTGGLAGRGSVHPINLISCATPPFGVGLLCL
jgi:hypothetical protein